MGNTLLKRLFGKREVRILIFGLDASGKTTTLYRLKLGEVVTTIPTIGFNVETVSYKNVNLTAWDIGGRNKMRPLYRHYYQNTQGVVFVIDSNDRERLDEAIEEIERMALEDELREVPILVMANKQDLPIALKPEEIFEKLNPTLRRRKIGVFGVSATSKETQSTGLFEAFDWLVDAMTDREKVNEIRKWLPQDQDTMDSKSEENSEQTNNKDTIIGSLLQSLKGMLYRVS